MTDEPFPKIKETLEELTFDDTAILLFGKHVHDEDGKLVGLSVCSIIETNYGFDWVCAAVAHLMAVVGKSGKMGLEKTIETIVQSAINHAKKDSQPKRGKGFLTFDDGFRDDLLHEE